jgi:8-oxo-dGTP diphosphatase
MQKGTDKKYKFAVIAIDVVILTINEGKLQALLIKMDKKPYENYWAAPGGLVKPNESVNEAARRHLFEKTGLKNVYLEQLYTFGEVDRDPFGRVVSVAYFVLIPYENLKSKIGNKVKNIEWFAVDDLPPLAYDHANIIKTAIERLRAKLSYTNIIYGLLPEKFTLGELQKTYEIILKRRLDKRNFRKKLMSLNLIKSTAGQKRGEPHRPARLFSFVSKKPQIVEIL